MSTDRHIENAGSPDDAVLDAARAAILAVGWRRTTLTDVARRAGLSRMTLYRRWPDMRSLLADVLTREWGGALVEARTDGVDHLDALRRTTMRLATAIRTDPLFVKIVEVDPELLLPYLLDRRGRSQQLLLDHLHAVITAGQADGQVRPGDADVLARALLLAAQGFVLSVATMDEVAPARLDVELGELVTRYLAP